MRVDSATPCAARRSIGRAIWRRRDPVPEDVSIASSARSERSWDAAPGGAEISPHQGIAQVALSHGNTGAVVVASGFPHEARPVPCGRSAPGREALGAAASGSRAHRQLASGFANGVAALLDHLEALAGVGGTDLARRLGLRAVDIVALRSARARRQQVRHPLNGVAQDPLDLLRRCSGHGDPLERLQHPDRRRKHRVPDLGGKHLRSLGRQDEQLFQPPHVAQHRLNWRNHSEAPAGRRADLHRQGHVHSLHAILCILVNFRNSIPINI